MTTAADSARSALTVGLERQRLPTFADLCELLPADVHWGDELTPDVLREVVMAVESRERVAAELRCAKTPVLIDGHHEYTALSVQRLLMDAISERSNAKSQATDAALSRQVACPDWLGVAAPKQKENE